MGISLGRQFRALKLWFVLRAFGLERLRNMIRNYIAWSCALWEKLHATKGYEIVTEPLLSPFSFRYVAADVADLDGLNLRLVGAINIDGRSYVTQTIRQEKAVSKRARAEIPAVDRGFQRSFVRCSRRRHPRHWRCS